MAFEVEIKFRTEDHADLARRLTSLGGKPGPLVEQEDAYLSHPARDFAESGEALRLRREGAANRLTYKGPRHGGPTKTREEIEIGCEEGAEAGERLRRLWEVLGFRTVAVLHKRRQAFHLQYRGRPFEVVLDVAEGLGTFAEVEAIARDAADLTGAQAAVLDLARALGLTEVEHRSYLRMALERRADGGAPGGPDAPGDRKLAGQT
jgi:adenylate cyclase class 2